jgi:hypothetical protein
VVTFAKDGDWFGVFVPKKDTTSPLKCPILPGTVTFDYFTITGLPPTNEVGVQTEFEFEPEPEPVPEKIGFFGWVQSVLH